MTKLPSGPAHMRGRAIVSVQLGARNVSTRTQTGIFAIAIYLEERPSLKAADEAETNGATARREKRWNYADI